MTAWPAIAIITAVEVAVTLGPTTRCFGAQARIDRERDDDIRAAIAGYEAGIVIPALADLVTEVIEVRREDEPVSEALARAEGTASNFAAAVEASIRSQLPRARERALVHRYLGFGAFLVAAQVAGPVAIFNVVTDSYNLSQNIVIAATVIFSIGALGALMLAILVMLAENALMRAIREGKDVA